MPRQPVKIWSSSPVRAGARSAFATKRRGRCVICWIRWDADCATFEECTAVNPQDLEVVLKRFDAPDEVRRMQKGTFAVVRIGGMTIGRAEYEPGWKWSEHVGAAIGKRLCSV